MVKLMLIFKHPSDEEAFELGYVQTLALLEKMPNILRQQANMVLGSPLGEAPYYRLLEFYFEDYPLLDAAMRSPAGVEAGKALMGYAADVVEVLFVDVLEENYG